VLRVVTANAAGGRDRHGRTGAAPWGAWADAAAALAPDLLAVQEVDHLLPRSGDVDQTAALRTALEAGGTPWHARFAAAIHGTPGARTSFTAARSTRTEEPSYGIALLSRHPVRRWDELRLTPSRATLPVLLPPGAGQRFLWVPDEPRVALAAVVAAPGGDVSVLTTHLSFNPQRAWGQLREVLRWSRDLPRPLVLLGDLNLPGRLPVLATGLTSALRAPTHPASRPRVQLDHVLLDDRTGGLTVHAASTRVVGDSDHLAVEVELNLMAPPPPAPA
jgi:endonuclease/exonuclease/phosphatase family metal-dependent hydrolase